MDNPFLPPPIPLKGLSTKRKCWLKMVKESVVNFKDPKLTKELNLIENNRINSLASIDRMLTKVLSIIF